MIALFRRDPAISRTEIFHGKISAKLRFQPAPPRARRVCSGASLTARVVGLSVLFQSSNRYTNERKNDRHKRIHHGQARVFALLEVVPFVSKYL